MVDYSQVHLGRQMQEELEKLHIRYVFQPIFKRDGKTIFAYEALMRPENTTVDRLIEQYTKEGKLHFLEVATFIGAVQSYLERGYQEYVTINSFPSEGFTEEEKKQFDEMFPDFRDRAIIEILEYPALCMDDLEGKEKPKQHREDFLLAIDDFGNGNHTTLQSIDIYHPNIVKLARELVNGVNADFEKLLNIENAVEEFHKHGILVVAEGIETWEEFECLKHLGVDLFQGYYLGMPT